MSVKGFDKKKIDNYFRGKYSDEDESYLYDVICDNNHENNLKHLLSSQFEELLSADDNEKKNLDHILYKVHYEMNMKHAGRKGINILIILLNGLYVSLQFYYFLL